MVKIDKITIAVTDMEMMEKFYTAFFKIDFTKHEMGEFYLLTGKVEDIQIMLCPKEIAGIEVNQNNIQLRFAVENIEEVVKLGVEKGGAIIEDVQQQDDIKIASLRDPDGNSIELRQGIKS